MSRRGQNSNIFFFCCLFGELAKGRRGGKQGTYLLPDRGRWSQWVRWGLQGCEFVQGKVQTKWQGRGLTVSFWISRDSGCLCLGRSPRFHGYSESEISREQYLSEPFDQSTIFTIIVVLSVSVKYATAPGI